MQQVTREEVQALTPAERRALGELLRYVATWTDAPASCGVPRSGLLHELRDGRGFE
jgi:hypothetical protein